MNYALAEKIMQKHNTGKQEIMQVSWKHPRNGWVCLNIDGACKNGVIGCEGVIRGSEGEWLYGFSKVLGQGNAYIAEAWGYMRVFSWLEG